MLPPVVATVPAVAASPNGVSEVRCDGRKACVSTRNLSRTDFAYSSVVRHSAGRLDTRAQPP